VIPSRLVASEVFFLSLGQGLGGAFFDVMKLSGSKESRGSRPRAR
jgi:hypothetical protein